MQDPAIHDFACLLQVPTENNLTLLWQWPTGTWQLQIAEQANLRILVSVIEQISF